MPKRTWTDEQLTKAVTESISMAQCLSSLKLRVTGGNHTSISKHIDRLNLDRSHWLGQAHLRGKSHNWTKRMPDEEMFCKDSKIWRSVVRRRILKDNLLPYECQICGISEWLGNKLSLNLDHINGIPNDHRLENLRFLCPNCDTQTDTYCGRNNK